MALTAARARGSFMWRTWLWETGAGVADGDLDSDMCTGRDPGACLSDFLASVGTPSPRDVVIFITGLVASWTPHCAQMENALQWHREARVPADAVWTAGVPVGSQAWLRDVTATAAMLTSAAAAGHGGRPARAASRRTSPRHTSHRAMSSTSRTRARANSRRTTATRAAKSSMRLQRHPSFCRPACACWTRAPCLQLQLPRARGPLQG